MSSNNNKQHFKVCFCWSRGFKLRGGEIPEDIKQVFESYSVNGIMSIDNLISFLEKEQKEVNVTKEAQNIFNSLKHHHNIVHKRGLNLDAFFKYLIGDYNFAHQSKVHQNMDAPLAHYYIYTGHNSYLTGNQLSSDCSTEPIKKALKKGVRVIELDLWPNITKDDIDVRHGGTLTTPVKLSKCLKAIKEVAFSNSEYPVILTFEDHLHPYPHLQKKVAQMVKKTFGSMLFIPQSQMDEFPSPNSLKNKILISTKPPPKSSAESDNKERDEEQDKEFEEVLKYRDLIAIHATKHKGGMENFGRHASFDKVGRLSMNEQALEKALAVTEHGHQLIRFTQRHILRVYPKGARIDSSNYDPLIAWMRGAQMVAFNMQGYCKYLWMMQGFFRANGGCGYVKKPEFLLSPDGACHEVFNSMALPVKTILKVKIFMGEGWRVDFHFRHFDYCSPPDFYARVGIVGVPTDTSKMCRTRIVDDQWIPIWNEKFEFPIRVPELALLRIDVKDYDPSGEDEFAGQTCLPVSELRTGIRCVPLHKRRGDVYRSVKLLMRFDFMSP
ncbi:PREDICTED: phosphoinositide phospholipase C 2-like isoform X1 [Nicotiana attenuata]|uniref:Phosphoinositide phospholipase C n=1 Tax=Nicotiana attenuata TaxID=49451 RepID=A0A314L8N8_NICAT|nr:PREDICTED: phosphoinositide phospholipase C 2-like isoform X1 [Nicotiana attenuata]OIT37935.1 phosphoinositide phospholipase c 2 [Nicotiana attenuata]